MQAETAQLGGGPEEARPRAEHERFRALRRKYDRPVPRYTSYPTAPHFHDGVEAGVYGDWLSQLAPGTPLSLYLHIPYCDSLCWFCGCHTKVTRRYEPLAAYVETLLREIELVAARLPGRAPVTHVHWGGGSPAPSRRFRPPRWRIRCCAPWARESVLHARRWA